MYWRRRSRDFQWLIFGDAEGTHGDMDFVLQTLETHFMGSVNVTYELYVFN